MVSVKGILGLPSKLLTKIFGFLDHSSLSTSVRLVCKSWKRLAEDPSLWMTLSFEYFKSTSPSPLVTKLITRCSQLRSIIMKRCLVNSSVAMALSTHCPLLEDLSFDCNELYEKYTPIPCLLELKCHRLKSLSLCAIEFRESDSQFFFGLVSTSPFLKSITLEFCLISEDCDNAFQGMLSGLSGLSTLRLPGTKSSAVLINSITVAVNLISLDLNFHPDQKVTDDSIISIVTHCRNLKELNISNLESRGGVIRKLFCLRSETLETINLYGGGLNDIDFIHIDKCLHLARLDIRKGNDLTDYLLHQIQKLPNLQHLDLAFCCGFSTGAFVTIFRSGKMSQLKILNLYGCRFLDDTCLKAIADFCPRLDNLDIGFCGGVTTTGVRHIIRKCSNLRVLDMELLIGLKWSFLGDLERGYLRNLRKLNFDFDIDCALERRLRSFKKKRPEVKVYICGYDY